jgi:hypothetical protein
VRLERHLQVFDGENGIGLGHGDALERGRLAADLIDLRLTRK